MCSTGSEVQTTLVLLQKDSHCGSCCVRRCHSKRKCVSFNCSWQPMSWSHAGVFGPVERNQGYYNTQQHQQACGLQPLLGGPVGIWYSHELLSLSQKTLRSCLLTLFSFHLFVLWMKEAPYPTQLLCLRPCKHLHCPLLPSPFSSRCVRAPMLGTAEQRLIWIWMLIRNEQIEQKAHSQG